MGGRMLLVGSLVLVVGVILVGGCAPGKYMPKTNEELYGTWINEKITPQKNVISPGSYKNYTYVTDSSVVSEGTMQIFSKWTDSEGNVWYKTRYTCTLAGGCDATKGGNINNFEKSAKG